VNKLIDDIIDQGDFKFWKFNFWDGIFSLFSHVQTYTSMFSFFMIGICVSALLVILFYSLLFGFTGKIQHDIEQPKVQKKVQTTTFIFFAVLCFIFLNASVTNYKNNPEHQYVKNWISSKVTPYINTLPEEKLNIVSFKPTIASENLEITYLDETGKELTVAAKAKIISGENAPFMTFKKLSRDLGHGFTPGMYHIELHTK
jgi:F0F1-type ATP synthase membrane subunit c/vacuolar-type H+-ATPase subunit K